MMPDVFIEDQSGRGSCGMVGNGQGTGIGSYEGMSYCERRDVFYVQLSEEEILTGEGCGFSTLETKSCRGTTFKFK